MSCMNDDPKKKSAFADEWFGAGIALGVAFGIIFENLGLWLPIGVCIGLVGPAMKRIKNKNSHSEQDNG